ncbi:hypothetical protein [Ferrovibrio sp.]|uniref:hypothetical protein n=1 Tax=Ferrovibrio sp. TaxID=1917215 RepID=UPI00263A0CEB|nr:hypothetical protein [Ferrovibrio sp.]
MSFPGAAFFLVLAILQFFIVADGLVSWLQADWMLAANVAALLSGLPLLAMLKAIRDDRRAARHVLRQRA